MGDEPAKGCGSTPGVPDETLADLELELDAEDGDETVDIDGADVERPVRSTCLKSRRCLKNPKLAEVNFSTIPEQDLDLDIEASLETEKWMSESGDDDTLVADEELDLSELEQVLDDVDTEAGDEPLEDQELELDLGDDNEVLGTRTETVAIDNDLEFDLSDFEDDGSSRIVGAGAASRESSGHGTGIRGG